MIDRKQRAALREALTELVEGRMTNDKFDDLYADQWAESEDQAVAMIGNFGHCLYTDLMTYRLEGRHAIDSETRTIATRCLRFLSADLEYAWPKPPGTALQSAAGGLAIYGLLPLGVVLLFCALIFGTADLLLAGPVLLGLSWLLWWASRTQNTPEWREYWSHGDRDAWPFLHRADCDQAPTRCLE